jgi:hypothetical protein
MHDDHRWCALAGYGFSEDAELFSIQVVVIMFGFVISSIDSCSIGLIYYACNWPSAQCQGLLHGREDMRLTRSFATCAQYDLYCPNSISDLLRAF